MALASKLRIKHGLLMVTESGYGDGGSPTGADDAILVEEPVVIVPEYLESGERSPEVGQGGHYPKAQPGGRQAVSFVVPVLGRGADEAYSASVVPPELDVLLQICGHTSTLDDTGGSETYTYDPTSDPSQYTSGFMEAYADGEQVDVKGIFGTMSFEIAGPTFSRWEAECSGFIDTDPSDASVPSLTIDDHQPPKAEGITLTIGDYTPVVRAVRFNQNRAIGPRPDQNASSGHAGFNAGRALATLEVDIEADTLSTSSPYHESDKLDPYQLHQLATSLGLSFTVGDNQYNRFTFSADQAQVNAAPEKGEDAEGVALWTLSFQLNQTAPGADDAYQIVFD